MTPPMNVNAIQSRPAESYHVLREPGRALRLVLAGLRASLGFIFLWAFADKTFGLGYSTPVARSWLNGGSPTMGFLSNTKGPASGFFQAIAGNVVVDWLFMAALLGIGLALILGIGMRVAAASGALLMFLMWAAAMPAATNPIMDDHVVYALVLVALALANAGRYVGLGNVWSSLPLVKRFPILE